MLILFPLLTAFPRNSCLETEEIVRPCVLKYIYKMSIMFRTNRCQDNMCEEFASI